MTWTAAQKCKLRTALDADPARVAFVITDAWGRPSNGGSGTECAAGVVQKIPGPLQICTAGALHGTMQPHRWRGVRVWVALFGGDVQREGDKLGALRREIIGEILPDDVIDASVAIRMGESGAYLSGANLSGANLTGADLSGANLSGADLSRANLSRAYLSGANLSGAYLSGANLSGANLTGADLSHADLSGADLTGAYLSRADLSGANLSRANLSRANLSGAYCPCPPPGWVADDAGYLSRAKGEK